MRAMIVVTLVVLGGCVAPLRGAVHHHPEEIYRVVIARDKTFSKIAELPKAGSSQRIVVEAFADRVLTPTGVYLDDWNEHGLVTESYFTPHVAQRLFDRSVDLLRAAGFDAQRSYGPFTSSDTNVRVLQVEIAHAELHRWAKKQLFNSGSSGTIDLARVDYHFRWRDGAGAEKSKGSGSIQLLLPPDGDDLDAIAKTLTRELIAQLR